MENLTIRNYLSSLGLGLMSAFSSVLLTAGFIFLFTVSGLFDVFGSWAVLFLFVLATVISFILILLVNKVESGWKNLLFYTLFFMSHILFTIGVAIGLFFSLPSSISFL